MGEHEDHEDVFRERLDDVRLDGFETFIPGSDTVEAEMDPGVVIAHLGLDLGEVGLRDQVRLDAEFDAWSVIDRDRHIRV